MDGKGMVDRDACNKGDSTVHKGDNKDDGNVGSERMIRHPKTQGLG